MGLPTIGTRIRLVRMGDDPDPIEPGTEGTVDWVSNGAIEQIGVKWDNGRTLGLVPGVDIFTILT